MFERFVRLQGVALVGFGIALGCAGKGEVDHGDCPTYIACADAVGSPTATLEATYGVDGVCWEEDDEVLCRAACEDGLTVLAETYPDEAACVPGGGGETPQGAWGVDDCHADISGSGTTIGSVGADFALTDQNGDTVHLYDFCGRAVLIYADTMWSGALNAMQDDLQGFYDDYSSRGLQVVVVIGENIEAEAPTQEDLQEVADFLGRPVPVLADPSFDTYGQYGLVRQLPEAILFTTGAEIAQTEPQDALDERNIEAALP